MKILIVDDSRVIRAAVRDELEKSRYDVIEAPGGNEAYSILQDHKVDLIILDIEMPKLNGFETYEKIRSKGSDFIKNIPIIFFSAKDKFEYRQKGFELGAIDFISKNFERGELAIAVNKILKPKQLFNNFEAILLTQNKLFVELISKLLTQDGLHLHVEQNDDKALNWFDKEEISILFVDIDTPDLSLESLLPLIRKRMGNTIIPIVILSKDQLQNQDLIKYMNLGASDYFSNPIIKELFQERVRSSLRSYAIQKNLIGNMTQLKTLNELKDKYLMVFSNDLMTPLTTIVKNAKETLSNVSGERDKMALKEIETLGGFVYNLLGNLIDLRKIELDEDYAFEAMKPYELFENIFRVKTREANIQNHNLNFDLKMSKNTLVLGDPNSLERALNNLISYSVNNLKEGGEVSVKVMDSAKGAVVTTVRCKDHEQLINKEDFTHIQKHSAKEIFEEDYFKDNSIYGLVIAFHIIKSHQGIINYEIVDNTQIFTLSIPTQSFE